MRCRFHPEFDRGWWWGFFVGAAAAGAGVITGTTLQILWPLS